MEWSCHRVLLVRSAHHLALAASALQFLKSGTLFLYLSVPVPVLIPSVVISRPTTASRPSNPLNHSPLAPQIRLLLTIMRVYDLSFIDLLTYYLLTALVLECNAWLAEPRFLFDNLDPLSSPPSVFSRICTSDTAPRESEHHFHHPWRPHSFFLTLQIFRTVAFFSSLRLTPWIPRAVYRYFWAYPFLLFSFSFFHFLVFCSALTYISLWAQVKIASYHIVSFQSHFLFLPKHQLHELLLLLFLLSIFVFVFTF